MSFFGYIYFPLEIFLSISLLIDDFCLLVEDRNVVVNQESVVLVVWGEKRECLQKMLPRDEVAGCLSVIARRGRDS